jgi:hypothetical protein
MTQFYLNKKYVHQKENNVKLESVDGQGDRARPWTTLTWKIEAKKSLYEEMTLTVTSEEAK